MAKWLVEDHGESPEKAALRRAHLYIDIGLGFSQAHCGLQYPSKRLKPGRKASRCASCLRVEAARKAAKDRG